MLFHTDSNATVSTLPTPPNSPYTHRDNSDSLICETQINSIRRFFFNWWNTDDRKGRFTWASASVNEPSESGSSSEWDSRSATETLRRTKKEELFPVHFKMLEILPQFCSPDTYKPSASSSSSRNAWAILALSFSIRMISFFSESRRIFTLSQIINKPDDT